jgi:N-acetylmuramic acid 6-phosphate (MurNAc-6-P) etherase
VISVGHIRRSYQLIVALFQVSSSVGANIKFEYLMAGHDLALIKSQEKAEDDVVQSIQDLKKVTDDDEDCTVAVYLGITCGMSAPYVGSQIDWILSAPHPSRISFIPVLVGFNTTEMSRKTPIEGFSKTMYDIISQLKALTSPSNGPPKAFILNPILGPEPVAGSSRMKGGSATKLLIEMIAVRILHRAFPDQLPLFNHPTSSPSADQHVHTSPSSFISLIEFFERVNRRTYLSEEKIAQVVSMAGDSLKEGGHIYYLGEDSIAMIALIDASECPPTYGAHFSDVRGFVPSGWSTMGNLEGDMSAHGVNYQISDLDFESNVLPQLTEKDTLVIFHLEGQDHSRLASLLNKSRSSAPGLKVALVSWSRDMKTGAGLLEAAKKTGFGITVEIAVSLPSFEILPGLVAPVEISAKWILNAISTGAHIMKGKVWSNRMIDLNLSNDKLFRRGIALVVSLLSVSESVATDSIMKAIHRTDNLTEEIRALPISQHYQQAVKVARVVPIALLLASGKFASINDAEVALSKETILRNIIAELVSK